MTAGTETVAALFRRTFDAEPQRFWRAPGRVNLIGEHTDYNDGFVLPFAIDRATTIVLAPRDDDRIRLVSTFDEALVESDLAAVDRRDLSGWTAYPLGVAWAIGERLPGATRRGFDLAVDSDVPVGAGLSSSAAIEMAVAVALNDVWDLGLDRSDLARIGQRAENIAVGAPTGIMDQSASVFGERDAAVFLDCRSLAVEQVPLGFDAAGPGAARRRHEGRAPARHRRATGTAARPASGARAALGVAALRDLSVDDLPRAEALLDDVTFRRVRHVVTEDARVLESVEALQGRRPGAVRGADGREPRLHARRLRDQRPAARRGRRDRAGRGGRRRPDDRRRLRGLRDRPRRGRGGRSRSPPRCSGSSPTAAGASRCRSRSSPPTAPAPSDPRSSGSWTPSTRSRRPGSGRTSKVGPRRLAPCDTGRWGTPARSCRCRRSAR